MKPISEVYPDAEDRYFYGDYNELMESFGYTIALQVHDTDYQGDSRLLFQDSDRYGILIFGWGSCSGCDALQACCSLEQVDKLRQELHASIKWFDSAKEALEYFETHDWKGDYSWHYKETRDFVSRAIETLEEATES